MNSLENRMQFALQARKKEGNLRRLMPESGLIDFCSNDYLGLGANQELSQQIAEQSQQLAFRNGSGGSRLISGTTRYSLETEALLAETFRSAASLSFSSGCTAGMALLSAVPQKGDTLLLDEYIHASLKEGARLSFATRYTFRHNDLQDLEKKLGLAKGEVFVVTESIFSMDGDSPDLKGLVALCDQYGARLVLDEAHSTGLYGTGGSGMACEEGIQEAVFARIHTFGKALGVHGACVAGSQTLIDYLVNFARPFIYTTAPSSHSLLAVRCSLSYLSSHPELLSTIRSTIEVFEQQAQQQEGLATHFQLRKSAIQVVRISGNEAVTQASCLLREEGLDVRAILSPTVKEGEERLRICLHAYNSAEEMKKLMNLLPVGLREQKSL
jgi:8-amino-7-oxononanoate synthase